MSNFLKQYFNTLQGHLVLDEGTIKKLFELKMIFEETKSGAGSIFFLGNGGSAAMASHVAVDLTKNAKIRAINFNEADLITCFSNDYGYEFWMEKSLDMYSNSNDTVVLISSSGKSENILNAAHWCIKNNRRLITFSGMNNNNPLKSINTKGLNFWVDSKAYNHIEMVHHIWLLSVVDFIIGNAEYPA